MVNEAQPDYNQVSFYLSSDNGASFTRMGSSYAISTGRPAIAYKIESTQNAGVTYYFLGGVKDVVRISSAALASGAEWNNPDNMTSFLGRDNIGPDHINNPANDLTDSISRYFKKMTLGADGNLYLLSKDTVYVSTDEGETYTAVLDAETGEDFTNMDTDGYDLYVASTTGAYVLPLATRPWNGTTVEEITKGTGTAADPYLIENEAQWAWLSSMGNDLADAEVYYAEGVNYLITADLNFNDKPFPMLAPKGINRINVSNNDIPGTEVGEPYRFFAFLDGGNHTLRGVNLDLTGILVERATGIIRAAGPGSVIANLHIEGGLVKNTSEQIHADNVRGGYYVGAIVGQSSGDILQCSVIGTTVEGRTEGGGIVGTHGGGATALFKNNFIKDAVVKMSGFAGGVVGWANTQRETGYSSISLSSTVGNGWGSYEGSGGKAVNCFVNQSRNSNAGYGGTLKTEVELKDASILDLLNVNQREFWAIDLSGTINDGFPYLKNSYRVVLPEKEGLVFSIETGYEDLFFPEGDEYKFKMTISDPSMSAENLVLREANGNVLTADANGIYTIENISERQVVTIEGDLVIKTYTYDLTYDDTQGSVSGDIDEGDPVEHGTAVTFTITPEPGYVISEIKLNGNTATFDGNTFSVENITADFSLEVLFAKQTFNITATSSPAAGGSIDVAAGSVNPVTYGEDITFVVTPDEGYEVETVEVDGVTVSLTDGKYTFTNVTKVHTIDVTFALKKYTITASAGEGGTIDPDGEVSVSHGLNQVFTITPDANYKVASVLVDNATASLTDGKYTFTNVTGAHTISVTFESTVGLKNALANGWTITSANSLIQVTSAEAASFDVQLYNVSGKLLSITASEGNTAYVNAAPGSAYIVKIVCENETFTVKVAN